MSSCNSGRQKENEIKSAEWLLGTWENRTSKGVIYESWTRIADVEFAVKSYALKGGDTVLFETIRLVQEPGGLFYIPTVKDQNDGLPVRFALKTISDTEVVFENPEHDFPQIISYTKLTTDSLVAEVSGVEDGRERRRTFPMNRIGE